jgi:hypothetical protein
VDNPRGPWEQLLRACPQLAQASRISPQQAAFLAGYGCHLRADWIWVTEIFEPVFGLQASWETFRKRLYLHNVLRSYMDQQVLEPVRELTRQALEQVVWGDWLPFVQDDDLQTWRNLLTEQLVPGAKIQTVEVFASRQGISPQTYYDLLNSEQALEHAIFSHFPRNHLEIYRANLVADNRLFLQNYLGECLPERVEREVRQNR